MVASNCPYTRPHLTIRAIKSFVFFSCTSPVFEKINNLKLTDCTQTGTDSILVHESIFTLHTHGSLKVRIISVSICTCGYVIECAPIIHIQLGADLDPLWQIGVANEPSPESNQVIRACGHRLSGSL